MNINFNKRNNNRYLILFVMVFLFSAIVFLANYEDIQSVFANSQATTKNQMNNMMGMQNQNMMMDPSQIQAMMKQMNKTGMIGMGPMMMMGGQQWPMMGIGPMMGMGPMMMQPMNQSGMMGIGPMMGMGQAMTMPCMMMSPMMMGNQTMMGMMPCMMMNPGMMGMGPIMMDPSQMQAMMKQMNKTGMMMGPMMGQMNK
jgi:hypothetical protein